MGQNIGALWTKQSKNDLEYYSGNITWKGEKIKIVVFANTKKEPDNPEHENYPDYNILLNTPRSQG